MLTKSKFQPAWWLRNPHLQTLWAARVHPAPTPDITHERITTPDDDFLDLCWSDSKPVGNEAPLVIIFHGLTGSFKSPYIRALMWTLQSKNTGSVLMHFRGCSGEPNRTAGAYHSGHIADIDFLITTLKRRFPTRPLIAVGYSLGGNALIKYLGATPDNPLTKAISICPPLVLSEGAKRINTGFSKLYQAVLIKQMRNAVQMKDERYPALQLGQYHYKEQHNFIDWDHHVTAPLHGYLSGDDYYNRASSLSDLGGLNTRTHIIFSKDDPFFTKRCMPTDNGQLSPQVTFEVVNGGGHVGFICGSIPLLGKDWLRDRIAELIFSH